MREPREECVKDLDAKECILRWVDRGELLIARPLSEQLHVALEQLGFQNVRIDREPVHDVWLIRATVSTTVNCTTHRPQLPTSHGTSGWQTPDARRCPSCAGAR